MSWFSKWGKSRRGLHNERLLISQIPHAFSSDSLSPSSFSFLFSLPHCKALLISPCLLHVDMENILGWNSNDSYIHTLSLCSLFVFKLHFSPNRVYKPCLGSADHSLSYFSGLWDAGAAAFFTPSHWRLGWDLSKPGPFPWIWISGRWSWQLGRCLRT